MPALLIALAARCVTKMTHAMNCFQLIKTVLDEAYDAIPGKERAKDTAILAELNGLSRDYSNLLTKGCLDYSDPCRRFAYIFRYTTSHANVVFDRIQGVKLLRELFEQDKVTISCVGGGPGSDFLGVLKYCLHARKKPKLKCHVLDRDRAWSESWSDVEEKLETALRISTVFYNFNVTDPENWAPFSKHFGADLFTLIYFMSEVYAFRDKAATYFEALMGRMNPGALLLYVDNNDSRFTNWFDGLALKHGLKIVAHMEGWQQMPWDEDKDTLQPYLDKFGSPKLKTNIACRTARKE